MIPKRIICTHRSEYALEPKLRHCMEQMRALHSDWEFCFFSDADCADFVAEEVPEYRELYHFYQRPVMQADCFRMLAVYRLGGFYLDTDMLMSHPLDPLCKFGAVFPWEQTINETRFNKRFPEWVRTVEKPRIVGNYAFGAEAGHGMIQAVLDEMVIRTESFEAENCSDHDVIFSTGPDVVTSVHYRNEGRWEDLKLLSSDRSRFGPYGKHFVTGSWWQGKGPLP